MLKKEDLYFMLEKNDITHEFKKIIQYAIDNFQSEVSLNVLNTSEKDIVMSTSDTLSPSIKHNNKTFSEVDSQFEYYMKKNLLDEIKIFYHDKLSDFEIVFPLSYNSIEFYIKGTQWINFKYDFFYKEFYNFILNNKDFVLDFNKQHKDLYLILSMPFNRKFFLKKSAEYVLFLDENNQNVSMEYIDENWNILKPLLISIGSFKLFPKSRINSSLYEDLLKINMNFFKNIPKDEITHNMCDNVLSFDYNNNIRYVPEKYKTKDLYSSLFVKNIISLEDIPKNILTEEFFKLIVQKNGYYLKHVPAEFINYDICLGAIKQNGLALQYVSEEFKNSEFCLNAVKQNGLALQYVPETYKEDSLYIEAVKQNGKVLEHISHKHKTEEICRIAIEHDTKMLKFIPDEYKYYFAMKKNIFDLKYVPKEFVNYDLCLEAVKNHGINLQFVSHKYLDIDLCLEAVKQNGLALQYVSKELLDYNLCLEAVRQNGLALQYVSDIYREESLCVEAVNQDGLALQFLSKKQKKYNLCLLAVKQNIKSFEYVPEHLKDENIRIICRNLFL